MFEIPTLIFIDADSGELLQKNGITPIQREDINGELFPWYGISFD